MTEEDGAVGVRVQVPVLGVVTGIQALKEVDPFSFPDPKVKTPAVATRPLDGPLRTTAVRAVRPAGPSPVAAPRPSVPRGGSGASAGPAEPEAAAGRLMQLAENYLRAGLKPMALKKLREIVAKYPGTETAKQADLKIAELE